MQIKYNLSGKRKGAEFRTNPSNFPGFIGRQILRLPVYIFDLTLFVLRVLFNKESCIRNFNQAGYRSLIRQIIFSGIDALPIATLLALVSGLAITSQTILTIQVIGERADVIDILIRLVVYELSTLLTAALLIGRSGSAITVDLGSMKLHRELEGLEMLGININNYLIAPRILGAAISQTVLSAYFAGVTIVSGIIFISLVIHSGYFNYLPDIASSLHPNALLLFIGKNMFFGMLIGAVACYHGLSVSSSRTEIPQKTQQAIVNSLSIVFVLNAFFTILDFMD